MDLSQLNIAAEGSGVTVAAPHDDGRWINERVSKVVEVLRDYDRKIDVEWIPPDQRGVDDPAFRLIENLADGRKSIMFYVNDESEFDGRVLERVIQMDASRRGKFLDEIDARNAAVRLMMQKERAEKEAESVDLYHTVLRSPLHTFKHNGRVWE